MVCADSHSDDGSDRTIRTGATTDKTAPKNRRLFAQRSKLLKKVGSLKLMTPTDTQNHYTHMTHLVGHSTNQKQAGDTTFNGVNAIADKKWMYMGGLSPSIRTNTRIFIALYSIEITLT
jgi:hypothetical protein